MSEMLSNDMYENLRQSEAYLNAPGILPVPIGVGNDGTVVIQDLAVIPHILVCGHSGTGKTCFVQTLLTIVAIDHSPTEVKYIIYDSKFTEYTQFSHLPHMYVPVCNEEKQFDTVLQWANVEVRKRYSLFAEKQVKDLVGYNKKSENKLPHTFIVIDDLYNLLFNNSDSVIDNLKSLLVHGRQAGIHCIIVTSTPSSKVLQKEILSNLPCRISFAVASKADSRTVLGQNGAEQLAVPGELILRTQNQLVKCQAAHMTDEEILDAITTLDDGTVDTDPSVVKFLQGGQLHYSRAVITDTYTDENGYDEMLPQAVEAVLEMGSCSVSMLQRRIKLGYSRAARIVDQMEELGIVGPYEGAKPRTVLIDRAGWKMVGEHLGYSSGPQEPFTPKSGIEETDSIQTSDATVVLRPFHAATVKGGSFYIVNSRIHLTKRITTRIGGATVRPDFDGNAIREILLKKPRLFGDGYFQFVFKDTADLTNNNPELLKVEHENAAELSKIEFERANLPTVLLFLNQISEDCNIEITFL